MKRRDFFKGAGALTAGMALTPLNGHTTMVISKNDAAPLNLSGNLTDEELWEEVRKKYTPSENFINIENGYYSPQPMPVINYLIEETKKINGLTSYYMRKEKEGEAKNNKEAIAKFAGCSTDELMITRNTTESLNMVISGLKMKKGEEAIVCSMDYPSMRYAFYLKQKREGIVVKEIILPLIPKSKEEIISYYEKAITKKTKVMLVTHILNLSGLILPVKELCEMAHSHGVEVVVDGAHSFAHLNQKLTDFNYDYYGCSLHKWLCAPLGTGLLAVKKEKIERLWSFYGEEEFKDDDIRKMEHIGTYPPQNFLAIEKAIEFHEEIGGERKEKRLRYLQQYWTNKVRGLSKVTLNTSSEDLFACAIANVAVDGYTPNKLAEYLLNDHKMFTVAINHKDINGVRITPHLYNTTQQLDKLVEAITLIGK